MDDVAEFRLLLGSKVGIGGLHDTPRLPLWDSENELDLFRYMRKNFGKSIYGRDNDHPSKY